MSSDFWVVNSPAVVSEQMEDEVVIVDLIKGIYYSLQGTAATIWQFIDGGFQRSETPHQIAKTFSGDGVAASVGEFLDELIANEIFVAGAPQAPLPAIIPAEVPTPFVAARIEKFTDLQELLLLDPVHEVVDSGWPSR